MSPNLCRIIWTSIFCVIVEFVKLLYIISCSSCLQTSHLSHWCGQHGSTCCVFCSDFTISFWWQPVLTITEWLQSCTKRLRLSFTVEKDNSPRIMNMLPGWPLWEDISILLNAPQENGITSHWAFSYIITPMVYPTPPPSHRSEIVKSTENNPPPHTIVSCQTGPGRLFFTAKWFPVVRLHCF